MAFMYPHHIPQLPFYEELFEPVTFSRCEVVAAEKDDTDKPSEFVPDPSWAPRAYSRSYDPAGLHLTLPPHHPANAEQEDEQRDGSPLLQQDPNPVASDDEEDMASEGGSHNEVDDMDVDNANSEEDIEDM